MSVRPSAGVSVRPSVRLFLSLYVPPLSDLLLMYPFICLSVGLYVCLPVCMYVCLSVCLSVSLSVCLSVCLSTIHQYVLLAVDPDVTMYPAKH